MPKIIVKTEYIKEVSHLVNYLEYAGNKLEAQVIVYQDGTRQEQAADKLLQLAGLDKPVKGIELRTKDGRQQLLTVDTYRKFVRERESTAKKKKILTHDDDGKEIEMDFRPARYIQYIAERPGAEKFENGQALFGLTGPVPVEEAQQLAYELQDHIWWSHIVSIPREAADQTGFNCRDAWQALVRAKAPQIAKAYNISLENLVLNCAYHDKEQNPHIHLFVTSRDKHESFVLGGQEGMARASRRVKSLFFNEIFKGDVAYLKEQKNEQEAALHQLLVETLRKLGGKTYLPDRQLRQQFFLFAGQLAQVKGRKVYGYLPPELKKQVNDILKLAVEEPPLKNLLEQYQKTQEAFIRNYVDKEETVQKKRAEARERFFTPGKRDSTELHNVIIRQTLLYAENSPVQTAGAAAKENTLSVQQTRQQVYAVKNMLCGMAGLLSQHTSQLRQNMPSHPLKPSRNITEKPPKRKWRNYIDPEL